MCAAYKSDKKALSDSYEVELKDVEADFVGETEAGTTQRDVVRAGVVTITVSFSVSLAWFKKLTEYKNRDKIQIGYFDTKTLETRKKEMLVEGFKAKLQKDTSYKGLWSVNFTLKEF